MHNGAYHLPATCRGTATEVVTSFSFPPSTSTLALPAPSLAARLPIATPGSTASNAPSSVHLFPGSSTSRIPGNCSSMARAPSSSASQQGFLPQRAATDARVSPQPDGSLLHLESKQYSLQRSATSDGVYRDASVQREAQALLSNQQGPAASVRFTGVDSEDEDEEEDDELNDDDVDNMDREVVQGEWVAP